MQKLNLKFKQAFALLLSLCAFVIVSCDNEKEGVDPHITIDGKSNSSIEFKDGNAANMKVTITSNADWSVVYGADQDTDQWCTVSPASGKAGENIELTVDVTQATISRSTSLNIVAMSEFKGEMKEASVALNVNQVVTPNPTLDIDDSPITFAAEGGIEMLALTTENLGENEIFAEITGNGAANFSYSFAKDRLDIFTQENKEDKEYSAEIRVYIAESEDAQALVEKTISLKQEGYVAPAQVSISIANTTETNITVNANHSDASLRYIVYPATNEEYIDTHKEDAMSLAEAIVNTYRANMGVDFSRTGTYIFSGETTIELESVRAIIPDTDYNVIAFVVNDRGEVLSTPSLEKTKTLKGQAATGTFGEVTVASISGANVYLNIDAGDYTGNYIIAYTLKEFYDMDFATPTDFAKFQIEVILAEAEVNYAIVDNINVFTGSKENYAISLRGGREYALIVAPVNNDGTLYGEPRFITFTTEDN